MATLSQFRQSLTSDDLRERFEAACLKSAASVLVEDAGTADHANRLSWAQDVVPDATYTRTTAVKMLRWGLATNGTLQEVGPLATDNDIDFIVASALGTVEVLAMVR